MSEYRRAIDALFARTGTTAKLGLERTRALLEQLGDPHLAYPCFHVAGTNGKGSVVAMLDAMLRDKGLRVGRYTSPHLIDFRERIVVNGVQIGEDEVLAFLRRWEGEGDRLGATFFELTTVLAFDHFAREGVDVAVIETGMGGRLDATNVVTPLAVGIASVSLDHMEYLGDSIERIAREKAGILKAGVPAVVGPLPEEALREIRRRAEEVGAPLYEAMSLYPVTDTSVSLEGTLAAFGKGASDGRCVHVGLIGRVQAANVAVALGMLHVAGEQWSVSMADAGRVLPGLQLRGRLQRLGKFIVDVAHNVEGFRTLRQTLDQLEVPRPLVAVVGILGDKDWAAMLELLVPAVDRLILTSPATAPPDRRWDLDAAAHSLSRSAIPVVSVEGVPHAMGLAAEQGATVLVCGSFYTAGEALAELGAAAV